MPQLNAIGVVASDMEQSIPLQPGTRAQVPETRGTSTPSAGRAPDRELSATKSRRSGRPSGESCPLHARVVQTPVQTSPT